MSTSLGLQWNRCYIDKNRSRHRQPKKAINNCKPKYTSWWYKRLLHNPTIAKSGCERLAKQNWACSNHNLSSLKVQGIKTHREAMEWNVVALLHQQYENTKQQKSHWSYKTLDMTSKHKRITKPNLFGDVWFAKGANARNAKMLGGT